MTAILALDSLCPPLHQNTTGRRINIPQHIQIPDACPKVDDHPPVSISTMEPLYHAFIHIKVP